MTRRDDVVNIAAQKTTHAGLWLDKYLPDYDTGTGQVFVEEVSRLTKEDRSDKASLTPYTAFFKRWKAALAEAGVQANQIRNASVLGRLCVGLGGEAVLETAITLHRTYGMPYIPGSALKGLAARYADRCLEDGDWRKGGKAHTVMFGSTKSAGYLTFFDALYVPGTGRNDKVLWPDVITVHHPNYYQGNEPPADWDSPNPVPFLSATGDYLIAIGGDAAWADKAFDILSLALIEEGIGAKTSSGYGRMSIQGMATVAPKATPVSTTSVSAPPSVPMITRRGVIVEIQPTRRFGRVRDNETNKEYLFSTDVIEGNFPARKAAVEFGLRDGQVTKVKRV